MNSIRSHKDLEVWKRSIELVTKIYSVTNNFPNQELYGITSQIRRAAISIPSNISEGAGRHHRKELIQFLYVSFGSLSELETQLIISKNLKYLNKNDSEGFQNELNEIRRMILG
jgi:four helix bundle protein